MKKTLESAMQLRKIVSVLRQQNLCTVAEK